MSGGTIEFFLDVAVRGRDELDLLVRAGEVAGESDAVRRTNTMRVFCELRNEMGSVGPCARVVRLDEALALVVFAESDEQLELGAPGS